MKPKVSPVELSPDETVRPGFFAKVVSGPYQGNYGVYQSEADHDSFVLRTRDDDDDLIVVEKRHARPASPGRR